MRYQVQLTEHAQRDLQEIYHYIACQLLSPETADEMLARLEKAISGLSQMPERFRKYENRLWNGSGLHVMPVKRYLVFYSPDSKSAVVTVFRILYGGRNIDAQFITVE